MFATKGTIPISEVQYDRTQSIGKGAFAVVYRGTIPEHKGPKTHRPIDGCRRQGIQGRLKFDVGARTSNFTDDVLKTQTPVYPSVRELEVPNAPLRDSF